MTARRAPAVRRHGLRIRPAPRRLARLAPLALVALLHASAARAIEAFDGRVQIHGALEMQLRAYAKNYSADNGWDLSQWDNIASVEIETDILPDGWGPFDMVSSFIRAEARYDCVWTRGCQMFPSVNTFGNQAKRLPEPLSNARGDTRVGVITPDAVDIGGGQRRDFTDTRRFIQRPLGQSGAIFGVGPLGRRVPGKGHVGRIWNAQPLGALFFSVPGQDPNGNDFVTGAPLGDLGRGDDDLRRYPGAYVAEHFIDYRFGARESPDATGASSLELLGPWRPVDKLIAIGALADRANPYRSVVTLPLTDSNGDGIPDMIPAQRQPADANGDGVLDFLPGIHELPYRPAPSRLFTEAFDRSQAQGLYYPPSALIAFLDDGGQVYDVNFSQTDLQWNHGASQGDEQELKEAYLDIEMVDSLLWARLGRQLIVWGKTELFRAVDQFNPQDVGLSSLPSLEESRVPLWAARVIYNLGEFGPIEDLRIEGAVLLDEFEPIDPGQCGEPYAVLVTCTLSAGYLIHGMTGVGLAGARRPDDPWDDIQGLEGGARLEFRIGRFSVALSDYYGYEDVPYASEIIEYERNVDPNSGRPRRAFATGPCLNGPQAAPGTTEPACLGIRATRVDGPNGLKVLNPLQRQDVLPNHPSNQQLFATICASTAGTSQISPESCPFDLWNSSTRIGTGTLTPPISSIFGTLLSGGSNPAGPFGGTLVNARFVLREVARMRNLATQDEMPVATLRRDPGDGGAVGLAVHNAVIGFRGSNDLFRLSGLGPYLTDAQEALLGCGNYYSNPCDITGFDIFNSEASALLQSFTGFEGTGGSDWDTFVGTQPGTTNFVGGPVCTRFVNGATVSLPGCNNAPSQPIPHPFFGAARMGPNNSTDPNFGCLPECMDAQGQFFRSEMAALSFNLLMTLAAASQPPDVINNTTGQPPGDMNPNVSDRAPYFNEFDANNPYRLDGCSWRKPFLCSAVAGVLGLSAPQRATLRAGGNERFGRRDWVWASGSVIGLRHEKRNVLGLSLDFAEDWSKTAWSVEFSWLEGVPVSDFDSLDFVTKTDQLNLVFSVDRSTFVNFLNPNRTLFFNSQVFIRYIDGYRDSMAPNGPFNVLATFAIVTGYFQDRLTPSLVVAHDFQSKSGAVLVGVGYRYSEKFSATVGVATFYGSLDTRLQGPDETHVMNGLTILRDRDEVALRFRYTF